MTAIVPAAERRHRWPPESERRLHGSQFPDGCDRTEKTCPLCGLVKVTVHAPHDFPWREWRTRDGKPWTGDATPPCLGTAATGEGVKA